MKTGTSMKKTILLLLVLLVMGAFAKIVFFPASYPHGTWMEPFDKHLRKFDFANYAISDDYQIVTVRQGLNDKKRLILLRNEKTGQLLTLVKFREHAKADLAKIEADARLNKTPFWKAIRTEVPGSGFAIWSYLPFGWRDDIENAGRDVTIRGLQADSKENFETAKTNVLYLKGGFEKLGFYKKSGDWRPYVAPVLDFMAPGNGAIAAINDKKTGKTIFAVGYQQAGREFNEPEFQKIVESLDFEATELSEAFSNIKGLKKSIVTT